MIFDFVVVGAGVSGVSAAYELAAHGTVALLEAEAMPGYHSSGRSAALFTRNFGGDVVRRINQASSGFFEAPPTGFCDTPLLTPRGALTIAPPGHEHELDHIRAHSTPGHEIITLSKSRVHELVPLLREDVVAAALYEEGVSDIDADALQRGYLSGFKQRHGTVICSAQVTGITRDKEGWSLTCSTQSVRGNVIINAAGAWAGTIGLMAAAAPVALVPMRRTAIVVDPPAGISVTGMPAVDILGTEAYFKPEAGRVMASLGDETPAKPGDAQPGEMDIALTADWLMRHTTIEVRRIAHSWAGLRSFVADRAPVVGFDPVQPGFFWLAGQGGYGIMMAPALARATVRLITDKALPEDLIAHGVNEADISPARFAI